MGNEKKADVSTASDNKREISSEDSYGEEESEIVQNLPMELLKAK